MVQTDLLESLLDKYDRLMKNGMIREGDKVAKEIRHVENLLMFEANTFEYIFLKGYIEERMSQAHGRTML